MTESLIQWSTQLLTGWMAEWSTERLTEWLTQCLTELLIEWFAAIEVSVKSARSITNAM